ncbi:hypothetical protein RUM43_006585 [Polyplax serrata]|uniref:Uncharacterized protein n=1 Tax=Polyplax serrata TaxID=468196 RepID=A0AAN8P1I6_POLSC
MFSANFGDWSSGGEYPETGHTKLLDLLLGHDPITLGVHHLNSLHLPGISTRLPGLNASRSEAIKRLDPVGAVRKEPTEAVDLVPASASRFFQSFFLWATGKAKVECKTFGDAGNRMECQSEAKRKNDMMPFHRTNRS